MAELLIGCGNSRNKKLHLTGDIPEFTNVTTLDFDPLCGADVLHDLEVLPYPFEDQSFDQIHAYEVLEHTGNQGDWKFFFDQFREFHRILKPGGHLFATVPAWNSVWAWGDPSHKRVISHGSLVFLSQEQYRNVGATAMTDYRHYWDKDFEIVFQQYKDENFFFALKAL